MLGWNLDRFAGNYYTETRSGCSDCANLVDDNTRALRGGYWFNFAGSLHAAARNNDYSPVSRNTNVGFRCARSVE